MKGELGKLSLSVFDFTLVMELRWGGRMGEGKGEGGLG